MFFIVCCQLLQAIMRKSKLLNIQAKKEKFYGKGNLTLPSKAPQNLKFFDDLKQKIQNEVLTANELDVKLKPFIKATNHMLEVQNLTNHMLKKNLNQK